MSPLVAQRDVIEARRFVTARGWPVEMAERLAFARYLFDTFRISEFYDSDIDRIFEGWK